MKKTAIALAGLIAFAAVSPAAEIHVALKGKDANPGTPAAPVRTIQRAADLARPGDTITVHAGVYRERINTDSEHYGGSNVGAPFGEITAEPLPWLGKPHSLHLSLPPLATVIFTWQG